MKRAILALALAALAGCMANIPVPDALMADGDDTRLSDLRAGRELYINKCSGCHALATDASDRAPHDVGSRGKNDAMGQFRTPPLLHIGATAPYFHDGRYATLEQLLTDNLDRMGQTTQLSPDDLRVLAAFLRTL